MYFSASTTRLSCHKRVRCVFVCMPFIPFLLWQPCIHLNCVLHNHHRLKSLHLWNQKLRQHEQKTKREMGEGKKERLKWESGRTSMRGRRQIRERNRNKETRERIRVSFSSNLGLDCVRHQNSNLSVVLVNQILVQQNCLFGPPTCVYSMVQSLSYMWPHVCVSLFLCSSMHAWLTYAIEFLFKTLLTNLHWLCTAANSKWPC